VCESWAQGFQDDIDITALAGTGGGRRGVRSRGWAGWGVCELRLVDDQAVRGFMRRLLFTRSSSEQQRRRDVSTTLHEARRAWAQVVTKVARADPFAVCNLTNLADERLPTFICASPRFS
jgi:hypothetical protein